MNINVSKKPTESVKQMESEILTYINYNFPDYHDVKILEYKKEKIKHISSLFDEFDEIHAEREKYNLHWAFKKAHDAFQFNELKKSKESSKEACFKEYDVVAKYVVDQAINRFNWFSRSFSILNYGVSVLDIVISVILILAVTQISHSIHFDTLLLATMFIAFVALVKVSLDRFFIIPTIDRWGWSFFRRMINYTRIELVKLNATFVVLMESTAREESLEKRLEIITKQKDAIVTQRR